jgi:uncharacterized membrane protein
VGSFSVWHGIIVLFVVLIPAVFVAGIVWLAIHLSRARRDRDGASGSSALSHLGVDVANRLARLGELLAEGQITQEEYDRQRAAIIAGV